MSTLVVGFDAAWTAAKAGAIVGVIRKADRTFQELGPPLLVNYPDATARVLDWQRTWSPDSTLVLLDQPTIVTNDTGQREVEHLVTSPIGRRLGGMQPANTSRTDMFGVTAPLWPFLTQFGGPANPLGTLTPTCVYETYPALAMIALGWTLPHHQRATGRLPKYNPARRNTFALADWQHVCQTVSDAFRQRGLTALAGLTNDAAHNPTPRKSDQDRIDACICLLVGLHLADNKGCLMIGNCTNGYIIVPDDPILTKELITRCTATGRTPTDWVRTFRLPNGGDMCA